MQGLTQGKEVAPVTDVKWLKQRIWLALPKHETVIYDAKNLGFFHLFLGRGADLPRRICLSFFRLTGNTNRKLKKKSPWFIFFQVPNQ